MLQPYIKDAFHFAQADAVTPLGKLRLRVWHVQLSPSSVVANSGATVLGTTHAGQGANAHTTTLIRITQAGLKLLTLTGSGTAKVDIRLAGDMNHDGNIDGLDSALFPQSLAANTPNSSNGAEFGADSFYLFNYQFWPNRQLPNSQHELASYATVCKR